jgi:hypothetical protein
MPQTLPDRRQAHASVEQLGRVRVKQLVERAADPGLSTVAIPTSAAQRTLKMTNTTNQ